MFTLLGDFAIAFSSNKGEDNHKTTTRIVREKYDFMCCCRYADPATMKSSLPPFALHTHADPAAIPAIS